MKNKKLEYKYLNVSIAYFIIHFFLEVTCFYLISSYLKSDIYVYVALIYDFFAFVPQAIFGSIFDKYRKINSGIIGIAFIILSLLLFILNANYILLLIPLTIGNCIIHVSGAESTLRTSSGKAFPSSLFVAGGAIGIIVGKLLYTHNISIIYLFLINILSILLILYTNRFKDKEELVLTKFNYSNNKINKNTIIILATLVVGVRSFMSYGIPTTWNTTVFDAVMLYLALTLGKALGGLLVDIIGIRKTTFLSTIVALPFIFLGVSNIYLSLVGIMLFSMTMAITLVLIVSVCQDSPGKGFGYTTIGLFLGNLPMFFFKLNNSLVNIIIFTFLSLICIIFIDNISKKDDMEV